MPAPAPTELLAEDVRDLRESNRQIASEIKSVLVALAPIQTELKVIRWMGSFFAGILVTLVVSAITLSWYASAVVAEVRQQGVRLDKVDQRLDKVDQRLDKIDQRLDQMAAPKSKS